MPVWLRLTVLAQPQPMALTVGSRLGHYDVTALIGEGGMGERHRPQLSREPARDNRRGSAYHQRWETAREMPASRSQSGP